MLNYGESLPARTCGTRNGTNMHVPWIEKCMVRWEGFVSDLMQSDVICLTVKATAICTSPCSMNLEIASTKYFDGVECRVWCMPARVVLCIGCLITWLSVTELIDTREVHAVAVASRCCDRQALRRRRDTDLSTACAIVLKFEERGRSWRWLYARLEVRHPPPTHISRLLHYHY